jgi:capsular exopolysaccharide synthesis family protein
MSKIYNALRRMEMEHRSPEAAAAEPLHAVELLNNVRMEPVELEGAPSAKVIVPPQSRLVALTDPKSLGAEKFHALITRLETLRLQRELKSVQVTSSVINEGKTLVAANLAVTLAKRSNSKVLLVEGDLRRPALTSLFGLTELRGLAHWRTQRENDLVRYVYRLNNLSLWLLGTGTVCDQPSDILQSARFAEAFTRLNACFDWIVVDSTPMVRVVDVNLWSRLVDGTLLVVREGVTPVKGLKKGLASLDNPKLVGVILNDASEFGQANYKNSDGGSK